MTRLLVEYLKDLYAVLDNANRTLTIRILTSAIGHLMSCAYTPCSIRKNTGVCPLFLTT